jgi:hypothetical protein
MHHAKNTIKLGRNAEHRNLLLANQVTWARADRKRICAQAVQAWKDEFAKYLADV